MTDEIATPIFERGNVVYGDDPFKGEEDARPWLILSNHQIVTADNTLTLVKKETGIGYRGTHYGLVWRLSGYTVRGRKILRISFHLNKNTRWEKDPNQIPLVNSSETTHQSPAKPP